MKWGENGDEHTGAFDVVDTLLYEERDGSLVCDQALKRNPKVVTLPVPPCRGVQGLSRFGGFWLRRQRDGERERTRDKRYFSKDKLTALILSSSSSKCHNLTHNN